MATRIPLILNQTTARVEELDTDDQLPGSVVGGLMGDNAILNGGFGIWQRGSSRTLNAPLATYVADRWQGVCGGPAGPSMIMSQQSFLPSLDGALKYAQFQVQNAVAGTDAFACQLVQGVQTYAGKATTVTLYGWANANNTLVGVRILQRFGTGGSADVETQVGTVTLDTTPGYVTVTFDVPPIDGKILGTADACVYLILDFCKSSGYGNQLVAKSPTVAISMVKWELGTASTIYRHPDPNTELWLCQKFYEKSYQLADVPGTVTNLGRKAVGFQSLTNITHLVSCEFKVRKRSTPAVTLYPSSAGAAGGVTVDDGSRVSASLQNVSENAFEALWNPGSGRWGGFFHWVADAEIF